MENDNYSRDKNTPIIYIIQEENDPILDADILSGNSRIDHWILQFLLDVLAHQENSKDFTQIYLRRLIKVL